MLYQFEEFELDTRRRELRHQGNVVAVERQVFALIEILVKHHDRMVSKEEINEHIWNNRVVSDAVVNSRMRSVRKAIGDSGKSQHLVKTVYGQGFRFVGNVKALEHSESDTEESSTLHSEESLEKDDSVVPIQPHIRRHSDVKTPWLSSRNILIAIAVFVLGGTIAQWMLHRSTIEDSQSSQQSNQVAISGNLKPSVAVLPFDDMSEHRNLKYLADGLAEELLNVLARVSNLKVASRTSSFIFRDGSVGIPEIGDELGVNHVVEGSVRKSGNTVRITVQLIDVNTNAHVWSKTYDRELTTENLLTLQDDVALSVADELTSSLDLSTVTLAPRVSSLDAYETYLRGKELLRRKDSESIDLAIESFNQAIFLDKNYAPAYAGLADAHMLSTFYGGRTKAEVLTLVKHNVELALKLAPNNPDSLYSAAGYAQLESRHEDVLRFCEQAIAINPNFGPAYHRRAGVLPVLGRMEEALDAYKQAIALDPLSAGPLGNYAWTLLVTGDLDGALNITRKNLRWNPASADALNIAGVLYEQVVDYASAVENQYAAYKQNSKSFSAQERLVDLYMNIGLVEDARSIASYNTQKARIAAYSGDYAEAVELLRNHANDFGINEAAYMAREFQITHNAIYKTVTEALLVRGNALKEYQGLRFAELYYVFDQVGDPAASALHNLLSEYYADKTPADFKYSNDHLGGAAYQLISDNPDEAMKWLDAAIERGHAFLYLTRRPIFASLEQHPAYASRLTNMQENAARHRAAIKQRTPANDR